jgi:hypothetical protein
MCSVVENMRNFAYNLYSMCALSGVGIWKVKEVKLVLRLTFIACTLHHCAGTCGSTRHSVTLFTVWIPLPANLNPTTNPVACHEDM